MTNNEKDKSTAGLAALVLTLAMVALVGATSAAAGYAFGVVWGFLALGAWALLVAVAMVRVVRKIARDGDDG